MSLQDTKTYVGVDVDSKYLELFFPDSGKSERIRNEAKAIETLCSRLQDKNKYMFVMEATGGYQSILCAQLGNHGIDHAVVNPRRIREFSRGIGIDARTDKIDAKVISKFASVLQPIPATRQSDDQRKHSALVTRRSQLVDLITQETNRLRQTWDEEARASIEVMLEHLKNQLKTILAKSQRPCFWLNCQNWESSIVSKLPNW
jgi:transposase